MVVIDGLRIMFNVCNMLLLVNALANAVTASSSTLFSVMLIPFKLELGNSNTDARLCHPRVVIEGFLER